MSSSDPSKALFMQHFLKDLTIMLSGKAFHAADTHRATSEGAARKGRLKERCGLELRTIFFFRFRNRQKLVRIRFENMRYYNQDACNNTALREPIRLQFHEARRQAAGNVPKYIPNPLHSLASRI